jgi:hypothetical protein
MQAKIAHLALEVDLLNVAPRARAMRAQSDYQQGASTASEAAGGVAGDFAVERVLPSGAY